MYNSMLVITLLNRVYHLWPVPRIYWSLLFIENCCLVYSCCLVASQPNTVYSINCRSCKISAAKCGV